MAGNVHTLDAPPPPSTLPDGEVVTLPKADVVRAYAFLERLVVSLRDFGREYATPSDLTPARRQQMLEDFDRFFGPDFFRSAACARSALRDCVDDEEGEALSDSLQKYRPGGPPWQPDADVTTHGRD